MGRWLKAAQTGAWSDTHYSEDVPVPRWQRFEDEEIEMELLLKARNVRDAAVFPFVWEHADEVAYVRQGALFLDARRFGALPNREWESAVIYAGRLCTTVYVIGVCVKKRKEM